MPHLATHAPIFMYSLQCGWRFVFTFSSSGLAMFITSVQRASPFVEKFVLYLRLYDRLENIQRNSKLFCFADHVKLQNLRKKLLEIANNCIAAVKSLFHFSIDIHGSFLVFFIYVKSLFIFSININRVLMYGFLSIRFRSPLFTLGVVLMCRCFFRLAIPLFETECTAVVSVAFTPETIFPASVCVTVLSHEVGR